MSSVFMLAQVLVFVPGIIVFVLVVYTMILAIQALKIYINKNR